MQYPFFASPFFNGRFDECETRQLPLREKSAGLRHYEPLAIAAKSCGGQADTCEWNASTRLDRINVQSSDGGVSHADLFDQATLALSWHYSLAFATHLLKETS